MADDILLADVNDRIAVVTLNRPEARNALSRDLIDAILASVAAFDADGAVDAIILTGSDPAFSAGLDLRSLSGDPAAGRPLRLGELPADLFGSVRIPVIAAVNGVAVTGGLELVLACDFVVASERARFADTHARVGVMPGWGLTVLLAEAVGVRRARELSVTGNYIDAEVAAAWGLVNHVIAHADLLPFCRRLAADIVSNDQTGVRQMLDTYQRVISTTADDGWRIEAEVSRAWAAEHLDPAAVEARRLAIVERGRSQQT
jgi:enoyl-CoA hydratase